MNKEKFYNFIAWMILLIIVIALFCLVLFTGVVVLKSLGIGIEYKSVRDLVMFTVILFLLSIPIDIVVGALPKALYAAGKIKEGGKTLISFLLDLAGNMIGINAADYLMDSVKLSLLAAFVFAVILSATNLWLAEELQGE